MRRAPHAVLVSIVLALATPSYVWSDTVGPLLPQDATQFAPQETQRVHSPIERTPLGEIPITNERVDEMQQPSSGTNWFSRTVFALAVVLGLIFGLRYVTTKLASKAGSIRNQLGAGGKAPQGVLYVVARYPVARNQTLVLLQLHNRLLLTAQSSGGFQTLAELTDPSEVAQILAKADDAKGTSAAARFRQSLQSLEQDPGMLDKDLPDPRATNVVTAPAPTIVESKPPVENNITVKQYLKRIREAGQ